MCVKRSQPQVVVYSSISNQFLSSYTALIILSMASSDLEREAKEAFIDDHFDLAVDLYTQAIALSPTAAELFADRAQANIKLQNFTGNRNN